MENITISDIAAAAKVSIGTVSNVLSKKGNVKIETIRKVEEAAKLLGYVRNENAQVMKKKISNTILLIVPLLNSALGPLIIDLLHDLKFNGMELKIIEVESYSDIQDLLNLLKQGQYKAAVCLASIKDKSLINAIPVTKLITIGSPDNEKNTIEMNMDSFFKITSNIKEYTIISDKNDFSIYEIVMAKKQEQLNVVNLEEKDIPESFASLKHRKFIVFSKDIIEKLLTFYEGYTGEIPQFILISCNTGYHFYDFLKITKYYFSSNELALKIIKLIQALPTNPKKFKIQKERINIYPTATHEFGKLEKKRKIRLLLLKNPFSKALKQLATKFTKETNIEIEITDLPFTKLNELIIEKKVEDYDMIKLDVSYFPWLGPNLFLDLANIPEIKELADNMKNWRNYCYVDQQLLSLPADPSIQMMLYRKDVFENPIIQKAYSEIYNQMLLPPTSYSELADYSEFYQSVNIPEKSIPYPLSINKGDGILLASEFLPYFYSLGGEIKLVDGVFEVTSEAFVQTLDAYKRIRQNAKIQNEAWWDTEIENFNNRKTSIIICYTNHLNQIIGNDYDYCPVPGQAPAFGGGVLGITKGSKKLIECTLFFQWLYQYRIQEQLASLGVCIPRTHLFDERNNYRKYPFLSYSSKNFSMGKRLQYIEQNYVLNTIEIERIIGNEVNLGIEMDSSNLDILIKIHNQLNSNKSHLLRQYEE
ncbi:extracellular solute-binding protein [Enterococcus sp. BWT-B8]|uniref:extracellular solute-binding protein n=1 Tax=Enterococcus sp. BWT-B8 TaxID=2885157 RepID=UPI001E2BE437|nr:extracellular solute-binding protein [Enterococcus sp. BWT-B8]MCB5951075.1 extracellular solute-binding protein [Enterococcus sp. BWT-B8]